MLKQKKKKKVLIFIECTNTKYRNNCKINLPRSIDIRTKQIVKLQEMEKGQRMPKKLNLLKIIKKSF